MNGTTSPPTTPTDPYDLTAGRKGAPLYSGCLAYFPRALRAVAGAQNPAALPHPRERVASLLLELASAAGDPVRLAHAALALAELDHGGGSWRVDPLELVAFPVACLLSRYPRALRAVAACSLAGQSQHGGGGPLRWNRAASADHLDALARHLQEVGEVDADGVRHSAKVAWRALAWAELYLEALAAAPAEDGGVVATYCGRDTLEYAREVAAKWRDDLARACAIDGGTP